MVIADLKPCPLCGARAVGPTEEPLSSPQLGWRIGCGSHCFSLLRDNEKDAVADWNLRVPTGEFAEALEIIAEVARVGYDYRRGAYVLTQEVVARAQKLLEDVDA